LGFFFSLVSFAFFSLEDFSGLSAAIATDFQYHPPPSQLLIDTARESSVVVAMVSNTKIKQKKPLNTQPPLQIQKPLTYRKE
jgi:hypothetical protein